MRAVLYSISESVDGEGPLLYYRASLFLPQTDNNENVITSAICMHITTVYIVCSFNLPIRETVLLHTNSRKEREISQNIYTPIQRQAYDYQKFENLQGAQYHKSNTLA